MPTFDSGGWETTGRQQRKPSVSPSQRSVCVMVTVWYWSEIWPQVSAAAELEPHSQFSLEQSAPPSSLPPGPRRPAAHGHSSRLTHTHTHTHTTQHMIHSLKLHSVTSDCAHPLLFAHGWLFHQPESNHASSSSRGTAAVRLSVCAPLRSRLKYFNNYWMNYDEIKDELYRLWWYLWLKFVRSQAMNPPADPARVTVSMLACSR